MAHFNTIESKLLQICSDELDWDPKVERKDIDFSPTGDAHAWVVINHKEKDAAIVYLGEKSLEDCTYENALAYAKKREQGLLF